MGSFHRLWLGLWLLLTLPLWGREEVKEPRWKGEAVLLFDLHPTEEAAGEPWAWRFVSLFRHVLREHGLTVVPFAPDSPSVVRALREGLLSAEAVREVASSLAARRMVAQALGVHASLAGLIPKANLSLGEQQDELRLEALLEWIEPGRNYAATTQVPISIQRAVERPRRGTPPPPEARQEALLRQAAEELVKALWALSNGHREAEASPPAPPLTSADDWWNLGPGELLERARRHAAQGALKEAVRDYTAALSKMDPPSAAIFVELGDLFARQGLWEQALAEYERALLLEPRRVEYLRLAAEAALRAQRPAKALPHLKRLLQERPQDVALKQSLGDAYRALGQMALALSYYYEVLPALPPEVRYDFLLQLARWERERENPKAAKARLQEAMQLAPSRLEARWLLAQLEVEEGRSREAYAVLVEGLDEKNPTPLSLEHYPFTTRLLDTEAYALQKALEEEKMALQLGERSRAQAEEALRSLWQRAQRLSQAALGLLPPVPRQEAFLQRRLAYSLLEQAAAELWQAALRQDDLAQERAAVLLKQAEAELDSARNRDAQPWEIASRP